MRLQWEYTLTDKFSSPAERMAKSLERLNTQIDKMESKKNPLSNLFEGGRLNRSIKAAEESIDRLQVKLDGLKSKTIVVTVKINEVVTRTESAASNAQKKATAETAERQDNVKTSSAAAEKVDKAAQRFAEKLASLNISQDKLPSGIDRQEAMSSIKALQRYNLPVTAENIGQAKQVIEQFKNASKINSLLAENDVPKGLYTGQENISAFLKKLRVVRRAGEDPKTADFSGSLDDVVSRFKKVKAPVESAKEKVDVFAQKLSAMNISLDSIPEGMDRTLAMRNIRKLQTAELPIDRNSILNAQELIRGKKQQARLQDLGVDPSLYSKDQPFAGFIQKIKAIQSAKMDVGTFDLKSPLADISKQIAEKKSEATSVNAQQKALGKIGKTLADVPPGTGVEEFIQQVQKAKRELSDLHAFVEKLHAQQRRELFGPLKSPAEIDKEFSVRRMLDRTLGIRGESRGTAGEENPFYKSGLMDRLNKSSIKTEQVISVDALGNSVVRLKKIGIDWSAFWDKMYISQRLGGRKLTSAFNPAEFVKNMDYHLGKPQASNSVFTKLFNTAAPLIGAITKTEMLLQHFSSKASASMGAASDKIIRFILGTNVTGTSGGRGGRGGGGSFFDGIFGTGGGGKWFDNLKNSSNFFGRILGSLGDMTNRMAAFGMKAYFAIYTIRSLFYLVKELSAVVTGIAWQGIDATTFGQRTKATLDAVMTPMEQDRFGTSDKVLQEYMGFSEKLRVDPKLVTGLASQLKSAGFEMPEIPIAIQGLTDIASVSTSGTPHEVLSGMMRAIQQIKNNPTLRQEEMEQLREHLAPAGVGRKQIYESIAKRLIDPETKKQMTPDKLNELINSGAQVDSGLAIYGIFDAINAKLGGKERKSGSLTQKMGQTVGGQLEFLRSRPFMMAAGMEYTPGMQAFSGFLENVITLTSSASAEGQNFKSVFVSGLSQMFENIFGQFTGDAGKLTLLQAMTNAMSIMVSLSKFVGSALGLVVRTVIALSGPIAPIIGAFSSVLDVVSMVVSVLIQGMSPLFTMVVYTAQLVSWFITLVTTSSWFVSLWRNYGDLIIMVVKVLSVMTAIYIGMVVLTFLLSSPWLLIFLIIVGVIAAINKVVDNIKKVWDSSKGWLDNLSAVKNAWKEIFTLVDDTSKAKMPLPESNNKGQTNYVLSPAEFENQATDLDRLYSGSNYGGDLQLLDQWKGNDKAPTDYYIYEENRQKAEMYANMPVPPIVDQMTNMGLNASTGLQNGMMAGMPGVEQAAAAMSAVAPTGVAETLDIHSPSRVLYDYGLFAAEGLANGLSDGAANVQLKASDLVSVASLSQQIAKSVSESRTTSISGGSPGAQINVTVNMPSGLGTMKEYRDFLQRELPVLMKEAIEEANIAG